MRALPESYAGTILMFGLGGMEKEEGGMSAVALRRGGLAGQRSPGVL